MQVWNEPRVYGCSILQVSGNFPIYFQLLRFCTSWKMKVGRYTPDLLLHILRVRIRFLEWRCGVAVCIVQLFLQKEAARSWKLRSLDSPCAAGRLQCFTGAGPSSLAMKSSTGLRWELGNRSLGFWEKCFRHGPIFAYLFLASARMVKMLVAAMGFDNFPSRFSGLD